jgi:transposase InsO family protein
MTDDRKSLAEQVALFRLSVLGDLVHLAPGSRGIGEAIAKRSAADYNIPGTLRTQVAPETIRGWLKDYRRGGFEALLPKQRKDAGGCRAFEPWVCDLLCTIKEAEPDYSVAEVIAAARDTGELDATLALPPSTVHRVLSRASLMKRPTDAPTHKDHRRFEFAAAGQMWHSDVMHGPAVPIDGRKKRKTYLIAFIDDATRVIPFAAFAHAENTEAFLPVFKSAIERRGIAQRLFVDNGSAYRSQQLALCCAKLGTTLIHARAYHPQAKAKIERWFRTCRRQLVRRLSADDTASLDALNRRLWAYVEGEYHRAPHKGLGGISPLDRWAQVGADVRYPEVGLDLDDLFLWEAKRKVKKDRTVSLHGVVYEVDAALVDTTVTLRYAPDKQKRGAPVQVVADGQKVGDAFVVDVRANCFVKRNAPPSADRGLRFRDHTRARGDD